MDYLTVDDLTDQAILEKMRKKDNENAWANYSTQDFSLS